MRRPSAKAGHIPSWRRSCERPALSPIAAAYRWSLLAAVTVAVSSAQGIRWQADPDRRATRSEDRKRRGRATHYGRVTCVDRGVHPGLASGSQVAAGGDRWLLTAVRGVESAFGD